MALKFQTNIPIEVTFPYGDAKEVEGNYGPQFMYSVSVEGENDRLYATPTLHGRLVEAGIGPQATFTIEKSEEGNRTIWLIDGKSTANGAKEKPRDRDGKVGPLASTVQATAQATSQPAKGALLPGDVKSHALQCLAIATSAWTINEEAYGLEFEATNVQGLASTIFIQTFVKGFDNPVAPPAEDTPSPGGEEGDEDNEQPDMFDAQPESVPAPGDGDLPF